MTLYMIIEPVHLLPEVKSQCNSYIIVYLKSIIRNYSIAGKKRPLACFRRYLITLPNIRELSKACFIADNYKKNKNTNSVTALKATQIIKYLTGNSQHSITREFY